MSMLETMAAEAATVRFPVRGGMFGRATRFVSAVDRVDLALHENETVALVGESGSGKSTLGLSFLGLRPLSDGVIRWRGKPIATLSNLEERAFRRDVQVVFQDPYASLNPRQSIAETLSRPVRLHRTAASGAIRERLEAMLDRVGLRPAQLYADRYPHEFSGGQRQRVAIARALILEPRVLVADEPVSALDVSIRAQIIKLLQGLKADFKLSMLFLSHDLGVVRFLADRVAVMYLGKIVEIGPTEALFRKPNHPYTRVLLSSAPSLAAKGFDPVAVVGEPPKPTDPPPGCRFHTRCPFAFDRCRVAEPQLALIDADHRSACHLNDRTLPTVEEINA